MSETDSKTPDETEPQVDLSALSEQAKQRAAEIDAALARGAWVSKPKPKPSPVQPIGAGMLDGMELAARAYAERDKLFGETGQFHCWECRGPCAWHVSLLCPLCKADAPRRKREQDERERMARQQPPKEQSAPSWAGRGFRRSGTDDEY